MQILCHFMNGTWASADVGVGGRGPGTNPNPPLPLEGWLYLGVQVNNVYCGAQVSLESEAGEKYREMEKQTDLRHHNKKVTLCLAFFFFLKAKEWH